MSTHGDQILRILLSDYHRQFGEVVFALRAVDIYTVENFLLSWKDPKKRKTIVRMFDSYAEAEEIANTLKSWLGWPVGPCRTTQDTKTFSVNWYSDGGNLNRFSGIHCTLDA